MPCSFDGDKVRVGNHAGPVHFELEKILPIDVLCPIDAIQNWQANLAIGVQFGVGNIKTLADFFESCCIASWCHLQSESRERPAPSTSI